MEISRRGAIAGLLALPAGFSAWAEAETSGGILGPTVFEWEDMKPRKTATGEVRSLYKGPTATVDQLEMHVTTLNPGMEPHPPHRHINEELIILREGECETLSDGKWVKVTPGSVVFNASNSLHGFRNVGAIPAVYHVINWSPNKSVAAKSTS
ncbi:MAG TPA: cupin domain-containing protein [Terracidiphilus sp.]|nr:cupin domain-containing protein [Terracidiphilus sp.]